MVIRFIFYHKKTVVAYLDYFQNSENNKTNIFPDYIIKYYMFFSNLVNKIV